MGKNTWTEGDILLEVTFSKTITAEFELRRANVSQIRIQDAQRIQFGDMMSAYLIRPYEELDLG